MLSGKLTDNSPDTLRCRNGLKYEQNGATGGSIGGVKERRNNDIKNNGREPVEGLFRGDREIRRGHGERPPDIETMDRGVGGHHLFNTGSDPERRIPYFHIPPYVPEHHRTSGMDPAMSPYFYPHIPFSFNQSLPVNSSTNEGRYQWPPSPFSSASNLHPPSNGSTPLPPDLGGFRGGFGPEALTSRLQWDQYHKAAAAAMHYGPLALHHRARGGAFSPTNFAGIPYGFSHNSMPGGYPDGLLPGSPFSPAVNYPGHLASYPDQTTAANIAHLSGSLEAAMQASSHLAALGKSRKRALSHSPIEFGLDIDSLTRSSEGSLLMSCGQASRSSSNASGSYGHLSAASLGVLSSGHNPFTHPLFRSNGSLPGSPFFNPMFYPGFLPPPPWHPGANGTSPIFNPAPVSAATPPTSTESDAAPAPAAKSSTDNQERASTKERSTGQVSSTVSGHTGHSVKSKVTVKHEEFSPQSDIHSDEMKASPESHNGGQPQEGEVDFYETNCHWKGCSLEFETQDDLVKHLNHDHISASKKLFVCQWDGCVRDEKPFKAQYMLVVHMRRHTGEKPHRCTFESCNKAYSRLENLKTHLRSHTGEKPYLCEFPGCTKAFSNASDRAKHQNRTHSNAKPYMCKAPGCSKCYTDPSSLRKHVKTVHGADFYANKKHKGSENNNNNNNNNNNGNSNGYSTRGDRLVNGSPDHGNNNDRKLDISNYNHNSNSSDSSSVSSGGGRIKVENCFGDFNATDNSPASTDLAADLECKMSPYFGSYSHSCMSPEVSGLAPNCDTSAPSRDYLTGSIGAPSGGENDDDIGSDFVLPPASVSVGDGGNVQVMRNVVAQGQRLREKVQPRFSRNNIPTLPPLGTTRKGWSSSSRLSGVSKDTRTSALDGRAGNSNSNSEGRGCRELTRLTRRDSNTSTLSSYMSSIRSDSSPTFSLRNSRSDTSPPYQPNHTRRRSADNNSSCSGSRHSIMNSPYEYDISGNLPNMSPGSDSNVGALVTQIEGTTLDSQPESPVVGGSVGSPGVGGSPGVSGSPCRFGERRGISSFLSMSRCAASYEVTDPSANQTSSRLISVDGRRASDPVRCPVIGSPSSSSCHQSGMNYQSLTDTKSEAAQLQSCSTPRHRRHNMSEQSLMSSRSSIATNFSMNLNQNTDASNAIVIQPLSNQSYSLDEQINSMLHPDFTNVDDIIIPDEMQEFLENQKRDSEAADLAGKSICTTSDKGKQEEQNSLCNTQNNSCMYSEQQQSTTCTAGKGADQIINSCSRSTLNSNNLTSTNTTGVCSSKNGSGGNTNCTSEVNQVSNCISYNQPTENASAGISSPPVGQHFENRLTGGEANLQQNYQNHATSGQVPWTNNPKMNQASMNYNGYNFCPDMTQYQQYHGYWRMPRNGYHHNQMYPHFSQQWQQMQINNRQRQHNLYYEQQGMNSRQGVNTAVPLGNTANQSQHYGMRSTNPEIQVPRISQSQRSLQNCFPGDFENMASLEQHPIRTYQTNIDHPNLQIGHASDQFVNQMPPPQNSNIYSTRQNSANLANGSENGSPPLNPWTQHYHMHSRNLQRYQGRMPVNNITGISSGCNIQASAYPNSNNGMNLQVPPNNRSMLQMSPGCDKVSSTTDALPPTNRGDNSHLDAAFEELCPENFLDNLTSISPEQESISPTELMMTSASSLTPGAAAMRQSVIQARASFDPRASQTLRASCDFRGSRMSGLLDTSNMIVTDMNSALSELVDDCKYHMI